MHHKVVVADLEWQAKEAMEAVPEATKEEAEAEKQGDATTATELDTSRETAGIQ